MDITTFLAQFWGPVLLAIGVGIFVSRPFYMKIYRDIEKDGLAVLLFGIIAMAAGIAHVAAHNIWGTPAQILMSLFGWGMILKGGMFLIAPRSVDRWGDWAVKANVLPVTGIVMLVVGGYLTWLAYVV